MLKYGNDTLVYATVPANWALGRMDATSHEAYASASGTYYIYNLGYVPGSVLGFGTVQSWSYDAGLDRLAVEIGDPGRFTIHLDVIIGAAQSAGKTIQIWPNPTSGTVYFETRLESGSVELIGMDGRMVLRENFETSAFQMDLHELSSGVYLARVRDAQGQVMGTQKLVVED